MDHVLMEQSLNEALKDSISSIMREARKAFGSPALLSEATVPANLDDMPREEILKIIRDSLKSIRLYGMLERSRLVELMGEIGEWIDRSKNDDDLEDMDPGYFLDVMSPNEVKDKNTFQIAAVILRKLNYITRKEESDIMEGLRSPPDDEKHKSALESLERKVDEASRETGNEPKGQASNTSLRQAKSEHNAAQENFRRAAMALYRSNLDSKTRRDAGTARATNFNLYGDTGEKAPIKSFEQDDLFNDFYIQLMKKAKKRSRAKDGSFLPWSPDEKDGGKKNAFDSALEDEKGDHLDRYLQMMINTKSSQIRQRRGSVLNPSGRDVKDSVPNRHRKRIIVKKDLAAYMNSGSLSPNEEALGFYREYMPKIAGESEEGIERIKMELDGDDLMRLEILKDIKYHSENSPRAKDQDISMDPARVYDSLSGYMIHILNSKGEKRPTFASDLAKDDGSSDDAVASMSKAVGNVKRERPGEDSDPMNIARSDSQDSDSGLSPRSLSAAQDIASGGLSLMEKFFRPYIIRSVKRLAAGEAGGDRSVVQSVLLCIKYGIPCSFTFENGEMKEVSVNEPDTVDEDLDEKIKSYLFEKLGQDSGGFMPSVGWKSWSDEGHVDSEGRPKEAQKTLRKDSFCSMFFTGQNSLYSSSKTQDEIIDIMIHLPETSSGPKKIYNYDPSNFQSSWTPTGKHNGLMKTDSNPKSKTYGQLVPVYRKSSIGEYLSGNPQAKRGAVSYLCDMVFKMITKDEVTLKDIMIRRNKERSEKIAALQAQREKDDEAYRTTTSRSLPMGRPSLSSRPNPLGRFLKKEPEEPSSP